MNALIWYAHTAEMRAVLCDHAVIGTKDSFTVSEQNSRAPLVNFDICMHHTVIAGGGNDVMHEEQFEAWPRCPQPPLPSSLLELHARFRSCSSLSPATCSDKKYAPPTSLEHACKKVATHSNDVVLLFAVALHCSVLTLHPSFVRILPIGGFFALRICNLRGLSDLLLDISWYCSDLQN